MEGIKSDPELATEMVFLLGRELKTARRRIEELENELAGRKHSETTEDCKQVLNDSEGDRHANTILKNHVDKLNQENALLRQEVQNLQGKIARVLVKVEEITPEPSLSATGHNISPERDEVDAEASSKIIKLEKKLEKYRGKYEDEREINRSLQEMCDTLDVKAQELAKQLKQSRAAYEARLHSLSAENTTLLINLKKKEEAEAKDKDRGRNGLIVAGRSEHNISSSRVFERSDFCKIMQKFPRFQDRPDQNSLQPICAKDVDLTAYLASDSKSLPCSRNFLYAPGRSAWTTTNNRHHAFAFGPLHHLDETTSAWVESSSFTSVYDRTVELFFHVKDCIYYAGSYHCHNFRKSHPRGIRISRDLSAYAIADAAITFEGGPRRALTNFYIDGVLQVECVGLQCVGFDHALYEALLERFNANQPSLKRANTDTTSERNIKRMKKLT